jgi:hypothetical protein
MTLREQVLVLVTAILLIGGIYGGLRFYPAHKAIVDIQSNTEMMNQAMKTTPIPEEPFEDVESLDRELEDVELDLASIKDAISDIEKRLSPADTTAVRLAVSDVARNALVRINSNEEYRVTVPAPENAPVKGKVADPKKKRMGDGQKKRLRNVAKAAAKAGISNLSINQVNPQMATALARKMAVNAAMERPMQRISVEGTYAGLMRFIASLEQMSLMVTIVQFDINPTLQSPPPGYNQRLNANLVLAM